MTLAANRVQNLIPCGDCKRGWPPQSVTHDGYCPTCDAKHRTPTGTARKAMLKMETCRGEIDALARAGGWLWMAEDMMDMFEKMDDEFGVILNTLKSKAGPEDKACE